MNVSEFRNFNSNHSLMQLMPGVNRFPTAPGRMAGSGTAESSACTKRDFTGVLAGQGPWGLWTATHNRLTWPATIAFRSQNQQSPNLAKDAQFSHSANSPSFRMVSPAPAWPTARDCLIWPTLNLRLICRIKAALANGSEKLG